MIMGRKDPQTAEKPGARLDAEQVRGDARHAKAAGRAAHRDAYQAELAALQIEFEARIADKKRAITATSLFEEDTNTDTDIEIAPLELKTR